MMRKIRHWLRLPLLTRREQRMLNGFWWTAASVEFPELMRKDLKRQEIPVEDKYALTYVMDEFTEAIDWLEGLKA